MKHFAPVSRRNFLNLGLIGGTALLAGPLPVAAASRSRGPGSPALKLGVASYTFRKFTLDQTLEMTRKAGLKYITLKDMHLPMKTTAAERTAVREKVQAAGITLMGGGVIYFNNDEKQIRDSFLYVKEAGMPVMVCCPAPEALDTVERLARESDVLVAIHNHGPGDQRYPSPLDVLELVRKRDRRMGICMDLGHTVRLGQEPVQVMHKCAERLYDFHIKDVTQADAKGGPVPVGRGVIDIPAVLRALVGMRFPYHVALEYEAEGDAPLMGVVESVAYIRGVLAGLG